MVVLSGSSRRARSTSTWIHCRSPVASAKASIIDWSTGSQSAPCRAAGRRTTRAPPVWQTFASPADRVRRRVEPASLAECGEMIVRVAEGKLDGGEALQVMARTMLVGEADASMELDRLLAHEARLALPAPSPPRRPAQCASGRGRRQ